MRTSSNKLPSYLIALSFAANVCFGAYFYNRERELNRLTWGYAVSNVWKHLNYISGGTMTGPGGQETTPIPPGGQQAVESLRSLSSLPYYNQRVESADMITLQQFLLYADKTYALAAKEKGTTGRISPESMRRLEKVKEGVDATSRHMVRSNQLNSSWNPWNHGDWRALWHDVATTLRNMDFVPLPE